MLMRYLTSATIGIAVTTALLWLMQYLIEIAVPAEGPVKVHPPLTFGRTIEEEPVRTDQDRIPPIPDPVKPPPTVPPVGDPEGTAVTGIRPVAEAPPRTSGPRSDSSPLTPPCWSCSTRSRTIRRQPPHAASKAT